MELAARRARRLPHPGRGPGRRALARRAARRLRARATTSRSPAARTARGPARRAPWRASCDDWFASLAPDGAPRVDRRARRADRAGDVLHRRERRRRPRGVAAGAVPGRALRRGPGARGRHAARRLREGVSCPAPRSCTRTSTRRWRSSAELRRVAGLREVHGFVAPLAPSRRCWRSRDDVRADLRGSRARRQPRAATAREAARSLRHWTVRAAGAARRRRGRTGSRPPCAALCSLEGRHDAGQRGPGSGRRGPSAPRTERPCARRRRAGGSGGRARRAWSARRKRAAVCAAAGGEPRSRSASSCRTPLERVAHAARVAARASGSCAVDAEVAVAVGVGADDRGAGGHRLERRQAEALVPRRLEEHRGRLSSPLTVFVGRALDSRSRGRRGRRRARARSRRATAAGAARAARGRRRG